MDTQTQIERLIELAIVQRSELKQLVSELPQLREYLSAEIERTFEETEPQIRTELEEFCKARASDEHAKTGAALAAKVEELSKALEVTTAAKYSVLMAERAENVNLLAKAEARIEDAASMLSHAVKEIVTDELSRFPRAGEIDQLRKEFAEPRGLNPRGRWQVGETYNKLDLVTMNGDSFVSNIDGNRERPSRTAGDWTLSAARGNGGGGGGVTTMTDLVPVPSNGQLLIGNGSAFVNSTLTAGTGISISNGAGSITINATDGNITLDDGTAAAPSLNFTNEPTTGLFRASANVMGFAVAGTSRATMTTTGMTVTGTITPTGSVHAAAGSLGNPSIAFNADQNTGLYNIGPDNIGVVANGAKVLDIATTGLGVTGTLSVSGVATLGAGAILNTPASGTLTNATGLPISTGVSGLGANVAAFLATPSSANLAAALTDETGTGALVFATSPTLTTPISATLTSPASSPLTLGTGTSGAAITVLSASNNVGIGTTSPDRLLDLYKATPSSDITSNAAGYIALSTNLTTTADVYGIQFRDKGNNRNTAGIFAYGDYTNNSNTSLIFATRSTSGDIAERMRIKSNGDTTLSSTTAGSSGAGALVVQGGISAAGTSYFGSVGTFVGGVSTAGAVSFTAASGQAAGSLAKNATYGLTAYGVAGSANDVTLLNSAGTVVMANPTGTTTATFAGAVTATSASAHTFGTTNTVAFTAGKISQTAVSTDIFSSTGATTAGRWLRLTNTSGDAYIGIESNAGGSLLTGSTPYATVITSATGVPVQIGTGDTLRATFASTGTTFAGAVTIAGTVIHTLSATPASASATGTVGTMSWDASYIYICTAANTWKRVAIATW